MPAFIASSVAPNRLSQRVDRATSYLMVPGTNAAGHPRPSRNEPQGVVRRPVGRYYLRASESSAASSASAPSMAPTPARPSRQPRMDWATAAPLTPGVRSDGHPCADACHGVVRRPAGGREYMTEYAGSEAAAPSSTSASSARSSAYSAASSVTAASLRTAQWAIDQVQVQAQAQVTGQRLQADSYYGIDAAAASAARRHAPPTQRVPGAWIDAQPAPPRPAAPHAGPGAWTGAQGDYRMAPPMPMPMPARANAHAAAYRANPGAPGRAPQKQPAQMHLAMRGARPDDRYCERSRLGRWMGRLGDGIAGLGRHR